MGRQQHAGSIQFKILQGCPETARPRFCTATHALHGTDRYRDGEFNLRCRACDHSCLNHIVPHYAHDVSDAEPMKSGWTVLSMKSD